jgi:hypothetical protein
MKQTTFASLSYQSKKKQTRREKFLAEMDQVVPWAQLIALIEPHHANKNPAQVFSLIALTNLYLNRRQLMA